MKKTIGILGGMGPEATSYFFNLLIKLTSAKKDQDHIPVIIVNNPKIPPRTDAYQKKGHSPVPFIVEGAQILKNAGADFIVMPCITVHLFLSEIQKKIDIPFLDLINETADWICTRFPELQNAGLIASTGTLHSQIFQNAFTEKGIHIIHPSEKRQEDVMEAIFGEKGIKAGFTEGACKSVIQETAIQLIRKGAEAIIAGCTEIPLVLHTEDLQNPIMDPLRIGAEACILKAGYNLKT